MFVTMLFNFISWKKIKTDWNIGHQWNLGIGTVFEVTVGFIYNVSFLNEVVELIKR